MIFGAILGLAIIVAVMAAAICVLRRPPYRYRGDPEPRERRSFRATMATWMTGGRG